MEAPHHNGGNYWRVTDDFHGDCGCCNAKVLHINDFKPKDERKRKRFDEALEAGDIDELNALRITRCPSCQRVNSTPTGAVKQCKDFYNDLKRAAGACACGAEWDVLEADHIDPSTKIHKLSGYRWWSHHGGVEALRNEAEKCRWLCRFCHRLEPTGKAARRRDPATMPDGKSKGTVEERKQYGAKCIAKITYPKQQFVDEEKLRRGVCLHCERVVTPETTIAFEFDHINALTKMIGRGTLAGVRGGVAGIVGNHANRARLENCKDDLVAEMAKCDLLCANCHHRKTHREKKSW